MSRRNRRGNNEEIDLKLNLSPPPAMGRVAVGQGQGIRRHRISTSSSSDDSPPRSCVSSEESLKYASSPETTSMVLVGCPRCLMYVMLSEADPRCPKCKSTVLLDFLRTTSSSNNNSSSIDDDDNHNSSSNNNSNNNIRNRNRNN